MKARSHPQKRNESLSKARKWDHDGPEHAHHGAGDGAVPDDQAKRGGEECEHHLDKEKYQSVIRVSDRFDDARPNSRLRLRKRVLHGS